MKKTHAGSCHCGAVRFEAERDLQQETIKCNCSICTKVRNWLAKAKKEGFRLFAGEEELSVKPMTCQEERGTVLLVVGITLEAP